MSRLKETPEGWHPTSELPPEGVRVDWMTSTGDIVYNGFRRGQLWFTEGGMYVYYTPGFWRFHK